MSEPLKKPGQQPESYQPHKPEIVGMVEQAQAASKQKHTPLKKRLSEITLVDFPKTKVASYEVTSGNPEQESGEFIEEWVYQKLGLRCGENGLRRFGFDCHKGRDIPEGCRIYHQYVTLPEDAAVAGDNDVAIKEFPGGRFARVVIRDPFSDDQFPLAWGMLLKWVFKRKIKNRLGCKSPKDCYSLYSNEESPCLEELYWENGVQYMAMYLPVVDEPAQKPGQVPESYQPKKPEVLRMAEQFQQQADAADTAYPRAASGGEPPRILPGIPPLRWEAGMDCCWAGAATLALQFMGKPYTYEQVMGLSGACYRLNFTEAWDFSTTDALVAFDYTTPLFRAIGRENLFACRLKPKERPAERQRIMEDLRRGRPVIAIDLRVAAEWGVITGYADDGKVFYCRTYFDGDSLNEREDYLESENWPFLIQHFGDETQKPLALDNLRASLRTLAASFEAPCERGYYQGREAYEKWIAGLRNEKLWKKSLTNRKEHVRRCLGVNESMLLNLVDARRCAAAYLRENAAPLPGVEELAAAYEEIYERLRAFREKLHSWDCGGKYICDEGTHRFCNDPAAHREQADLLAWCLDKEVEIARRAIQLLEEGAT